MKAASFPLARDDADKSTRRRQAAWDLGTHARARLDAVRTAENGITAIDVAERAGISRGTARRYVEYLEKTGSVELSLRDGTTGRPEHIYSWTGAPYIPEPRGNT